MEINDNKNLNYLMFERAQPSTTNTVLYIYVIKIVLTLHWSLESQLSILI